MIRARKRVCGLKRRLEERRRGELAMECMKELKRRMENVRELTEWERERDIFGGVEIG